MSSRHKPLYTHRLYTGTAAQAAGTPNNDDTAPAGSPSAIGTVKPDGCMAGKPSPSVQGENEPAAKQGNNSGSSHARLIEQAWQVVESKKKRPKGANPKPDANQETAPKLRKQNQRQRRRAQKEKAKAAAAATGKEQKHQGKSQSQTSSAGAGSTSGGNARGETRPREQPSAAGVNPGTVSPGRGAEVQKQKGSKRPDKKERDRLAKKRARTNETISPSGDQKKQKVDKSQTQPRQSYSEATKQDFAVAITKVNGILTQESADLILKDIMLKMISDGRASTADDNGPVFRAKPSYAEGYLRLWGDDQKTVDWLRNTVSAMTLPSGEKLTVKTQAEIPKRTRVGILIPDPMGVWKEVKDIGHVLAWQNKWAQCEGWLVQKAMKQEVGWFLVVSVPNDLVPTLVAKRRCLSCLLGAVYIRFQGPGGKFYETPPDHTQGTEGLKITGVQMPKTSSPKQGSSAMSVADEEPEATNSDMDAAQKPPEEETLKAFEDLLLDSDGEGG
ncbi:hypothetical protein NE865_07386 [Phthorimaea operculella]|nr:hypothetical protein NE865_07386 [Phthorimaea operculella]